MSSLEEIELSKKTETTTHIDNNSDENVIKNITFNEEIYKTPPPKHKYINYIENEENIENFIDIDLENNNIDNDDDIDEFNQDHEIKLYQKDSTNSSLILYNNQFLPSVSFKDNVKLYLYPLIHKLTV